jgi:hypothetical protein
MVMQVVAVASLVAAAVFAAIAWRLSRQEQRRSAARVAVLADAIDGLSPRPEGISTAGVSSVQPDFLAPARSAGSAGRGLLKLAIGFAACVTVIVTVAMIGSSSHGSRAAAAPAAVAETSLELLSMTHERADDTLTVTGLVRNGGPAAAQRLIAVVFAFDRSGNFVASGRAPVEFVTLHPGDESPFRVSVPHVNDVGRYRVSFRTDTGVVKHVDRRQEPQLAHR